MTTHTQDTKRKKLILIDGHAMIHRAFHAVPIEMSTRSGETVNATFGFTTLLMKALNDEKPDYIIVTFDRPVPTFRHLQFAAYKATRPTMPDIMRPQFARIREVVEAFGSPSTKKMASRPMTCWERFPSRPHSRASIPSSSPAIWTHCNWSTTM